MTIRINRDTPRWCALFLTLFYGYFTRTILAGFFFQGIMLGVMYILIYGFLCVSILQSATLTKELGLSFTQYTFWFVLVGSIITIGIIRTGEFTSLLGYSMVLLLPFACPVGLCEKRNLSNYMLFVALFISLGCVISAFLPRVYRSVIMPMFVGNDVRSIEYIINTVRAHSGFTSQTGYSSYFLCMGIGALFCMNQHYSKLLKWTMCVVLLLGLFLTAKRAPLFVAFAACLIVYFIEGKGSQRVNRFFAIVLACIIGLLVLYLLAMWNVNIPGVQRVFSVITELFSGEGVDDTGRGQLYLQAMLYIRQNPLWGIGWGNFKNLFALRSTHVHNIYLQLICETGVLGAVCFFVFFISQLLHTCRLIRMYKGIRQSYAKLSLYIQLYFLLIGLTDNPLYDINSVVFYFLAIGIGSCLDHKSSVMKARE